MFNECEKIHDVYLRAAISSLFEDYHRLEQREKELSEKIESLNKDNELVKIALTCPGVGPLTAQCHCS